MKRGIYLAVLLPLLLGSQFTFVHLANGRGEGGFELESKGFKGGEMIARKYTCDGKDISPPLDWQSVPAGTKSLALICDDPDAPVGTWVHWVYYDIPAGARGLPEGVAPKERPSSGGIQGINDFRKIGYGGPCPPGGTHRYYFKLYALDTMLNLAPGASKDELLNKMQGHVLGRAQLMGRYKR